MENPRIVELPRSKMVSSGCSTEENPFADGSRLMRFNDWWMAVDAQRVDPFFPRDFMWYDRENGGLVWYYAVTDAPGDTGGFEVIDFPGGLYAAAVSRDGDDEDGNRVFNEVIQWIKQSGCFELNMVPGHYDMFHVITPKAAAEAMGYQQLEIFVPIKPRAA